MFENDTSDFHERRIARCRTCQAKIIWFKTEEGNNMPVDSDTVEAETLMGFPLGWTEITQSETQLSPR